jgi:hypothetical protein
MNRVLILKERRYFSFGHTDASRKPEDDKMMARMWGKFGL